MQGLLNQGISVTLTPAGSSQAITISNVLVGEPSTEDLTDRASFFDIRTLYTLAIPKGDANDWVNGTVVFYGKTWHVVGEPTEGLDHLIPLQWNRKVRVERRQVRPLSTYTFFAHKSTTDSEGGTYASWADGKSFLGYIFQEADASAYATQGILEKRRLHLLTAEITPVIGDGIGVYKSSAADFKVLGSVYHNEVESFTSYWDVLLEEV